MPGLWNLYVPNRVCSSHLPLVGGCRCSWSLLTLFVTPYDSTAPQVMGSRKGLHCRFNTEAGWKKFWCRRSWFLGPKCWTRPQASCCVDIIRACQAGIPWNARWNILDQLDSGRMGLAGLKSIQTHWELLWLSICSYHAYTKIYYKYSL